MQQRAFTLIEVLLVTAIVVIVTATAWGLSASDRSFAVTSATTIFDAELAHAQTLAANGADITLDFAPAVSGSGVVLTLSPQPVDVPPVTLAADVSETSLGSPPFAIAVDAYGHAVSPQPCPAPGGYTLTFIAGGASAVRVLPCPAVAAGTPQTPAPVP
ncbi:MAG TPA: type II secretion system protein [Candidatus Rubrimentiphilum sp.]|nr:type II secretion system protein [Candidatus Rubrimentiphilum sp.]